MILTHIPHNLVAGNSFNLQLSFPDFSSADYTSSLELRGQASASIAATATGTDFLYAASSSQTNLASGLYTAFVQIWNATEMHTGELVYVNIIDNPATIATRVTSHETIIKNIDAFMAGDPTVASQTVNGDRIDRIPVDKLMAIRAMYANELAQLRGKHKQPYTIIPFRF